ncbi:hypothetical protein ACFL4V_00810 [Candidatus Latescibacterota bacterium]
MKINKSKHKVFFLALCFLFVLSFSCIFAPKEGKNNVSDTTGKWQDPIAPAIVIENLKVAFNDRDIDFYERCLHVDYFYESLSEIDSLDVSWSRSTDVRVMQNLFDDCIAFVFTPSSSSLIKEYGINIPDKPDGALVSDEHPDEIWYIYNYDITMDLTFKTYGEMKVHQFMKFVMVESPENHWSIIRWIDETSLTQ